MGLKLFLSVIGGVAGLGFLGCEKSEKQLAAELDLAPQLLLVQRTVKVVAHRGASGYELENSLMAFYKAFQLGSDGVELDIWRTVDDSLVVCHDRDTQRLTGKSLIIPTSTYAQIKDLTLSNGQRIPSLREVLKILPDSVKVFIEIKCCWEEGTAGQVFPFLTRVLEETGTLDRAVIISFNIANAGEVAQHLSKVPFYILSYVDESPDVIVARAVSAKCQGINVSHFLASKELVSLAKSKGLDVFVWVLNEASFARSMIDLGVDGITTDFPDIIINAVSLK